MKAMPKLTVCVPSRNRQFYFQETIRSLIVNLRTDVEFVFADNSDDPAIMRDFMKDCEGDPRIVFLPSADRVLSMTDNWDRCVAAATGDFVCIIGDDDYIDIDTADLIARTEMYGDGEPIDAFVWARMYYNWPDNRPFPMYTEIPLQTRVVQLAMPNLRKSFFSWTSRRPVSEAAFSIYHGALSRDLLKKMKQDFGGRYFEHAFVDAENCCKLLVTARKIVYCERALSVVASCAASNSAKIRVMDDVEERHRLFMAEFGRNVDEDPHMKTFPFPSLLGTAAYFAQAQNWFMTKYGDQTSEGWERNFAFACGNNCIAMLDEGSYDRMVAGYRAALGRWQDGRFLSWFRPQPYVDRRGLSTFLGLKDSSIYVDEGIAGELTPAEFYALANQMVVPLSDLKFLVGRRAAA